MPAEECIIATQNVSQRVLQGDVKSPHIATGKFMLDWDHWTVNERCIGELILEMFEAKDPSGKMEFQPKDIYEGYYHQLKEMWVPRYSSSASRQQGVHQMLKTLSDRSELIQPLGHKTAYYLADEGCLYQELKIRIANKSTQ